MRNLINGIGIEYIIVQPITKQNRKHKAKRFNKKYMKKYGFTTIDPTKGQCLVFGNTVFVNPRTYALIKQAI